MLHRVILDAQPGQIVDHASGDTFDNRRSNLRFASFAQNAFNRRNAKLSKHGFTGIGSQTPGSYRGRVFVNGGSHYTQTFSCPVMAAVARDVLAQRLHGEFSVLNFKFIPIQEGR